MVPLAVLRAHSPGKCACSVSGISVFESILVPRAAILLASATDREFWQGPKQELCESRTSCFLRSLGNLKQ